MIADAIARPARGGVRRSRSCRTRRNPLPPRRVSGNGGGHDDGVNASPRPDRSAWPGGRGGFRLVLGQPEQGRGRADLRCRTTRASGNGSPSDLDGTFEELVRTYQDRLYSYALRLTARREDAEEVAQDAFVKAYRALATYPAERIRGARAAAVALPDHAEHGEEPVPRKEAPDRLSGSSDRAGNATRCGKPRTVRRSSPTGATRKRASGRTSPA